MKKHPAFVLPPCCAQWIPALIKAIAWGQGEDYLCRLCAQCRTGQGIVIDLADGSDPEQWDVSALKSFAENTGFSPRLLTTSEERIAYLLEYQNEHSKPQSGALQLALQKAFGARLRA